MQILHKKDLHKTFLCKMAIQFLCVNASLIVKPELGTGQGSGRASNSCMQILHKKDMHKTFLCKMYDMQFFYIQIMHHTIHIISI